VALKEPVHSRLACVRQAKAEWRRHSAVYDRKPERRPISLRLQERQILGQMALQMIKQPPETVKRKPREGRERKLKIPSHLLLMLTV
jgi:hypothetical protein